MTGEATDRYGDGWLSGTPQYRTDLDRSEPGNAVGPIPRLRHWRTMPYATDCLNGTMLAAGPETAAPTVRYRLAARGLHAISIGAVPAGTRREALASAIPVKLSGDDTFTLLAPCTPATGDAQASIVEAYWKIADLTGQDLDIGQISARVAPGDHAGSFVCAVARVAYVKLVPLTDAEISLWEADQARRDTRRLFAHNDAHGPHYLFRLTTAEHVRREIKQYRESDVSRIYWEAAGGDRTRYFSQVGRAETLDEQQDFGRRGDRMHAESWRVFRQAQIDPFDVALQYAHDLGLEFHACYRVAGFKYPPPLDHASAGDTFYARHPHCRGEDRVGNRTPRMAYSYPEVREYVVAILREIAQRPVDGVCLLYNRRPPLVEYEPPVVEGFKQEFSEDPRALVADDPRWLSYRARTLTQFMREVRQAMEQVGAAQGRAQRIHVSAVVAATEQENLRDAIDVRAWVREGLVDTLIPYSSEPNYDSATVAWTDACQLEFFVDVVRGTACTLAPNLMPRHMSPEDFRRRAATIYAAGADHLFFWDCAGGAGRANFQPMWNALRRLGHKDEIEAWMAAGEPVLARPSMPLRVWSGWDLSYATPG